jgi:sugar-specific transcriptional regulator TrmB
MRASEEAIDTLKELGLSTVQAKTYIAIAKIEFSSIKEIASISGVPRTDLYRSIHELEKKGLVERVISKPSKFKAVSIDECVDVLYQRLFEKNLKLQKKILRLCHNFRKEEGAHSAEDSSSIYVLVPRSRAVKRVGKAINGTNESIEVVSSWLRFSSAMFMFAHELGKAWNRGVRCRFVVQRPESAEAVSHDLEEYRADQHCKFRFIPASPQTAVTIFDGKEVVIIENPAAPLKGSDVLWSNNRSLVSMAKEFFEILWITGKEDPCFQTDPVPRHDYIFQQ